jgi:hypothetical protein
MASPNPSDFVHRIDNPYLPLKPGTTFIYKSPDGSEVVRTTVTHQTKEVFGVRCVVVRDVAFLNGKLEENTLDYFAQDKQGNVWYFGEDAKNYHNGHFLNTDGSWLAGVNGATPGIVMEGSPHVGDRYDQENAPGIAEDRGKIVSLAGAKTVPFGTFQHLLVTGETNPLEPGFLERKYYAPGLGLVLSIDLATGDREELVRIVRERDHFNFKGLSHPAKVEHPPHATVSGRSDHHLVANDNAGQVHHDWLPHHGANAAMQDQGSFHWHASLVDL